MLNPFCQHLHFSNYVSRDYAFIHFVEREGAEAAMDAGEAQNIDGKPARIGNRGLKIP